MMDNSELIEEDSDTSDEDYDPGKNPEEVVSEVDSDGSVKEECLETEDVDKTSKKRRKTSTKSRKKLKNTEDSSESPTSQVDEKSKELTDEEKKRKEEDIWADFMKDTGFQSKNSKNQKVTMANKTETLNKTNNDGKLKPVNATKEKVKVTQVFQFAGEEVAVEKEVAADSAEARLLNKSMPESTTKISKGRPKGGLSGISGVLSQLGKKPKISTLEKSKLDWDKFKKEENLEEELQNYNKGKDGYLDRQDFLQRADLRRFEIEREIRTIERNKRMNNSV